MMLIRRQDAVLQMLRPFELPRFPTQTSEMRGEGQELAGQADNSAPRDPAEAELARLQARLDMLEVALEDSTSEREIAVKTALELGREEGRRAADELGSERLAALRDQLAKTSEACLSQLDEKSELAIEIARTAIRKILGEASPRAALVEEIVRNAIAQVTAGTLVAVRVSVEDFAADAELAELAREFDAVRVVRDDDLPSGGCRLELTLGTVDASLDVQLASIDRALGYVEAEAA